MDARDLMTKSARLRALLMDRLQLIAHNEAELKRLDTAGRIYATPHYRKGRYLYLLHPTDSTGSRKREYIGANPERVAEALAKVQNARNHDELSEQSRRAQHALNVAAYQMGRIIEELERVAPLDLATLGHGDIEAAPGDAAVTNPAQLDMVTRSAIEAPQVSPLSA